MSAPQIADAVPTTQLAAVVVDRSDETDHVISIRLRPDDGLLPDWEPGAHVDVVLPDGECRQYSLSGWLEDGNEWVLGVLVEHEGRGGSKWIAENATVGARLTLSQPRNHFRYDPAAPGKRIFVAGGIGVTPLLPMIARANADGDDWELHYVGRSLTDMAFRAQLEKFGDRIHLYPRDAGPRPDLEAIVSGKGPVQLYCCGPEGLMEAVEDLGRRLPEVSAHVERFSPKDFGDERGAEEFEVVFDYSDITAKVGPDQSILDVAEQVGIDVVTSCREGTCGSCETPVMEGTVTHLDSILSDAEREASQTMMICISRANCSRLVIDL